MTLVWAVPFTDVGGTARYVQGFTDAFGTIRASFRDELGKLVALLNVPDVSPPVGAVRFVDENGGVWGVPFEEVELLGPWQSAFRAAEGLGLLVSKFGLGLKTQAQNTAMPEQHTSPDQYWCEFAVEFDGCEQIEFGEKNTYRISGSMVFVLQGPIERGDWYLLEKVAELETFLSWTLIGDLSMGVASHIPFHRVASQWTYAVRCPFRYDFEERPPDPLGAPVDEISLDARETHSSVRQLFAATIAQESLPTVYDNSAAPVGASKMVAFDVLSGFSESAERGGPNRSRTVGVGRTNIMVPIGDGLAEAWRLVDVVASGFRAATFGGVTFETPSARSVGRVENWWVVQVDCPWYADRVRQLYV